MLNKTNPVILCAAERTLNFFNRIYTCVLGKYLVGGFSG